MSGLLEFIESLNSWGPRSRELGCGTFQQSLSVPGLSPEDNCFSIEEDGRVRGFPLIFPELPIGRSVLEMGIARDLEGTSQELELVRRSVDRARHIRARVTHICVAGNPSRAKMLEASLSFVSIGTWSGAKTNCQIRRYLRASVFVHTSRGMLPI